MMTYVKSVHLGSSRLHNLFLMDISVVSAIYIFHIQQHILQNPRQFNAICTQTNIVHKKLSQP